MFKNIWYNTKKSQIHLWEQINGEDLYTEIPWTPYVFLPSKKEEADVKTIFGKDVKKQSFSSYYAYHSFLEENKNHNIFENRVRNEIQFLAERYYDIPDDELYVPNLKIYYIDIEVITGEGFPDYKDPKDPVVLASIRNGLTGQTITFGYDVYGLRNYEGDMQNLKYYACDSEEDLMKYIFSYLHKYPCYVMSGYNIWAFDLPYMVNRAKVLWGEEKGKEIYNKMSPINIVSIWKQNMSEALNIDIGGLTILDYYNVYKWYGKNLERYTLEYVSQVELKKGKLENPYSSINEMAEKDWDRFVEYNVIDCERVNDLEIQLGYIRMIQAVSLLCKSSMKNYNAQTQLIEGLMLTYFRRNNLCAPHFAGGDQVEFKAAYVKEPDKGLHEWIVDVDITSSYPSHIITMNMSNETFMGKITRLQEEEIISCTRNRKFTPFKMLKEVNGDWEMVVFDEFKLDKFNLALKKGLLAISPNGSVFSTKKEGVVAKVEKNVFFKRKEVKGKRYEYGMKANACEDGSDEQKKYKEREKELNSLQLALKVMMNAFFGILSVPYSRYFNVYIAEAITAGGRHTIKSGEKFCNELLNSPNQALLDVLADLSAEYVPSKDKDYVKYIDTDSLFVGLGEWIKDSGDSVWTGLDDNEKIDIIKDISGIMEKYIDDRIYKEIQLGDYNSQVNDFRIGFKQEIIAKTALFVKKKKYAYWLLDKEGVPQNEIKVTGLEIIRSESAEAIRPRLKKIMEMIMKLKDDDEISKNIRVFKKELSILKPEELAANIGINNIKKYICSSSLPKGNPWYVEGSSSLPNPKKGTPWHVKGVYGYRLLLEQLGLSDKYEDIKEGLKARVVYVKKNPFNIETISFYDWPKEFDTLIQFDSSIMIEKFFIKKVRLLLEPIGKEQLIDVDTNAFSTFF
jgi:DNA polymerase elongation subunit (family B)